MWCNPLHVYSEISLAVYSGAYFQVCIKFQPKSFWKCTCQLALCHKVPLLSKINKPLCSCDANLSSNYVRKRISTSLYKGVAADLIFSNKLRNDRFVLALGYNNVFQQSCLIFLHLSYYHSSFIILLIS